MEIDTTNVTGGVLALTTALATPMGKVTAATAITAANTFTALSTISVEASSVTAFAEGSGYLLIVISHTPTELKNAVAKLAELANELRAALVAKGLIKGSA